MCTKHLLWYFPITSCHGKEQYFNYFQISSGQYHCWSLRCSWSITCQCCSNYIFILNLTPGFNIQYISECNPYILLHIAEQMMRLVYFPLFAYKLVQEEIIPQIPIIHSGYQFFVFWDFFSYFCFYISECNPYILLYIVEQMMRLVYFPLFAYKLVQEEIIPQIPIIHSGYQFF